MGILLVYNITKHINSILSPYNISCICMSSGLTIWHWTTNSFLLSNIAVLSYDCLEENKNTTNVLH